MTKEQIKEQLRIFIEVSRAILDAIKEAGETGIPSGHLYAMCLDKMPLHTYQLIIKNLVDAGLITSSNHLLKAREVK